MVPRTEQGDQTLILQNIPDSLKSVGRQSTGRGERTRHLELPGCLPERGVVLVELHCVGKHELDVLRKLSNIRVLLPLKVFLRKGLSKSSASVVT